MPAPDIIKDFVLLPRHVAYGQRDSAVRNIDDDIDPMPIKPPAGQCGADIRLVLMIVGDDVDRKCLAAEIRDRLSRAGG